jgi:glycosyltransferase involved in cell wall biosynthesis
MNKVKSILFHYSIFNIGGAEKSVLRLMKLLSDKGWNVTLVLTTGGGNLEGQIDPRVKVHHLRSAAAGNKFKKAKGLDKLKVIGDLMFYILFWIEGLFKSFTFLFRSYDIAAISLQGLSPKFVCKYVNTKKRFHWIRSDLRLSDSSGKVASNVHRYNSQIDQYICVSQTALESLNSQFPETILKSSVIYNIIDAPQILANVDRETDPLEEYDDILKVITVGRLFEKAKGLLRMVRVHKRLSDEGIDFMWFVVGDGPDRAMMQEAIDKEELNNKMILLGSKDNPFPYFKAADISATLSYYEGLCGAVNEAKVIGKPVLATQFSGINEQIINEESGLIVTNDEDAIYEGLKRLLIDQELREKLTNQALPKMIMDDDYKIEKLLNLIDEDVTVK